MGLAEAATACIVQPRALADDAALLAMLAETGLARCDSVVILRDLSSVPVDWLIHGGQADAFAELAFGAVRHVYGHVEAGQASVAAVCLGAWHDGALHPEAAILAGLLKSVARELPTGLVRCLAIEGAALDQAAVALRTELATAPGQDVEVAIRADGARQVMRLAEVTPIAAPTGGPRLTRQSVVVATGGGRGITAVLAEGLLQRFGCTMVLLGRSDPADVPAGVRAMDDAAFAEYEPEFYRSSLTANPKAPMPALRRAYGQLAAGRELCANLQRLAKLGTVHYAAIDVTDATSVDRAIHRFAGAHGNRVDLVVHGVGVQHSKRLPKRSLEDWRATLGPKLGGLRNLHAACSAHSTAVATEYHLITSAFSAVGNDGQADYGAANEAMGALATALNGAPGHRAWTALG